MGDNLRHVPSLHPQGRSTTGCLLQVLERAPDLAARMLSLAARRDMDESKLCLIFLGQVTGPVEHAGARWLQIHGAENPLARYRFQGRRILQVDPRPDRAIRIVENLGAGRPQNQPPVNSHALRRDNDEIRMIDGGAFDDLLSCLAMLHQLLYTKVPPTFAEEVFELLDAGSMHIFERAVVRGLTHVQQD